MNLKIKLEPCYPEGSTRKEQLAHIKQEYEELMEAIKEKSWQEQAREALDLAQTCIGYLDINKKNNLSFGVEEDEFALALIKREYKSLLNECFNLTYHLSYAYRLAWFSLNYFYNLASDHSRNNNKILNNLVDRFLQEHEEKLQSRRKEWNHGGSGS
jgi:phosphoribosyl-ATP pyrophosphohydrolase